MSFNKKPKTINPNEVDPSVYYYDEVYDDMKDEEDLEKTRKKASSKEENKKSKYIDGMKEMAEQRKVDKEIRKFMKYTRDREEANADGDVSDSDVYVTETYRNKLREVEKLEKEKRRKIEQEKDNLMNFIQKSENQKASRSSKTSDKMESDNKLPSTSQQAASSGERSQPHETISQDHSNRRSEPVRKSLDSISARREYLREKLAKRTVGKVYDDAVQRYIERKAMYQT